MKVITFYVSYLCHNAIDKLVFLHDPGDIQRGGYCSVWLCGVKVGNLFLAHLWTETNQPASVEGKSDSWPRLSPFSSIWVHSLLFLCTHTQSHTLLFPTPLIRQMTGKDSLRFQIRHEGNYWLLQLHSVSSVYQKQHRRKKWSVASEYYHKIVQTHLCGRVCVWGVCVMYDQVVCSSITLHAWESGFATGVVSWRLFYMQQSPSLK